MRIVTPINAFISSIVTSVNAWAFGIEERLACAYQLVLVTNRFQTSSVKYLQKRLSVVVLSSNGTVEPGISLYQKHFVVPLLPRSTSGRVRSVSDVVYVPCVDALRPLPCPVPGLLLCGLPHPRPRLAPCPLLCVSPAPVDPFSLLVAEWKDGELLRSLLEGSVSLLT